MSDQGDGAQPRCPVDGVLMRDIPGGWQRPACGHLDTPRMRQQYQHQQIVDEFDGGSIHGG